MSVARNVFVTDYGTYTIEFDPTEGCRMTKRGRPDRRTARGKAYAAWEREQFRSATEAFVSSRPFTVSMPQYQGAMIYV